MFGIGSDDEPLLQQRREVIPVEVNPASDSDRRAKRRRLHGTFGQECQDLLDDRRVAALQLQGDKGSESIDTVFIDTVDQVRSYS